MVLPGERLERGISFVDLWPCSEEALEGIR